MKLKTPKLGDTFTTRCGEQFEVASIAPGVIVARKVGLHGEPKSHLEIISISINEFNLLTAASGLMFKEIQPEIKNINPQEKFIRGSL